MAFKLVALHVPSQEEITYGPWPSSTDPTEAACRVSFAQGFICGMHEATVENGSPHDLAFSVVEVDDSELNLPEPEPVKENTVLGKLVADATATVTHADGTVD
jgi:hypothetical protein